MTTKKIAGAVVEQMTLDEISAVDLRKTAADEGGYAAYRIIPLGADGHRQSVHAQMIWHPEAGVAGIAWGADASWTNASDPDDAAERYFGINDKEMVW